MIRPAVSSRCKSSIDYGRLAMLNTLSLRSFLLVSLGCASTVAIAAFLFQPFYDTQTLSHVFPKWFRPTVQGTDRNTVMDSWHAPRSSWSNNLTKVIHSTGTHGFIFNSSTVPEGSTYGTYNYCNMPHVKLPDYPTPASEYRIEYVEVVSQTSSQASRKCLT